MAMTAAFPGKLLALAVLLLALPAQLAPAAAQSASKSTTAKSTDGDSSSSQKKKKSAARRSFREREDADMDKPAPKTLENAYSVQPNVPGVPDGGEQAPTHSSGERPDSN